MKRLMHVNLFVFEKLLFANCINLPTDWVQVTDISNAEVWPLLLSLSMERIENERLNIPVAAFQFWEQQDFKAVLKETMDKSAFYKFNPGEQKSKESILEKKKCKELCIYGLKCSKSAEI